ARCGLVWGYGPRSGGSYRATGGALDVRLDGVTNEALVAYCKTLPDTGCGYYPNSVFIHMDVREPGTGHVSWIDISRPGEAPKYVTAWPLPADLVDPNKLPALPPDKDPKDAKDTKDASRASLLDGPKDPPRDTPRDSSKEVREPKDEKDEAKETTEPQGPKEPKGAKEPKDPRPGRDDLSHLL